ncbi:MAG: hypothetical protein EZS28_047064 [Streblomastix strix]|uniref:Uncharacterized protein n=1 Tax=Streblomastix strix TaxID=222440 RepID=A0A5J4TH03_9EUKA|nr:MAG: hypothetical protein EZS28_047064 [Streblomastix strix]
MIGIQIGLVPGGRKGSDEEILKEERDMERKEAQERQIAMIKYLNQQQSSQNSNLPIRIRETQKQKQKQKQKQRPRQKRKKKQKRRL